MQCSNFVSAIGVAVLVSPWRRAGLVRHVVHCNFWRVTFMCTSPVGQSVLAGRFCTLTQFGMLTPL